MHRAKSLPSLKTRIGSIGEMDQIGVKSMQSSVPKQHGNRVLQCLGRAAKLSFWMKFHAHRAQASSTRSAPLTFHKSSSELGYAPSDLQLPSHLPSPLPSDSYSSWQGTTIHATSSGYSCLTTFDRSPKHARRTLQIRTTRWSTHTYLSRSINMASSADPFSDRNALDANPFATKPFKERSTIHRGCTPAPTTRSPPPTRAAPPTKSRHPCELNRHEELRRREEELARRERELDNRAAHIQKHGRNNWPFFYRSSTTTSRPRSHRTASPSCRVCTSSGCSSCWRSSSTW